MLKFRPVLRQRRLIELLATGAIGTIAISGPQATLLREHGVPDETLSVVPNLGMRMQPDEIADAASVTPESDRSAVAYFGRLSKEKGTLLLPALAAATPALRVFGDGYLGERLSPALGSLRGHVSQSQVAGVMAWARATVFPSLWPEPGGIVGLDAQLFGVPLASFAVGAALDWPATELFPPDDSKAMTDWLACQPPVLRPREPDLIAARQAAYWDRVRCRASVVLESFAATGRFPPLDLKAVSDDLNYALVCRRVEPEPR